MLRLINSIGQRKVSKILFFSSIFISLVCFALVLGANAFITPLTWLGIFLMSAPIGLVAWSAHKTKSYRVHCISFQAILILLNSVLYLMDVPEFFFGLTLLELVITLGVSLFFTFKKPEKVIAKRRNMATQSVTREASNNAKK